MREHWGTERDRWFMRVCVPWMYWHDTLWKKFRECIRHLRPRYGGHFEARFVRYIHGTTRCYCVDGCINGVRLFGFGWGFWLEKSVFTGPIPCPCDDAMHEMYHDPESVMYDPEACGDPDCPQFMEAS